VDAVWKVLRCLAYDYKIIFVSGRTEGCRAETLQWLQQQAGQDLGEIELFMRQTGDHRPDFIIKEEIYELYIFPNCNIIGVFDDRMQVCRMLYQNNIFCFNVNQGLKEF
jgi:hypothetical protein